jgi:hypothetical protein
VHDDAVGHEGVHGVVDREIEHLDDTSLVRHPLHRHTLNGAVFGHIQQRHPPPERPVARISPDLRVGIPQG